MKENTEDENMKKETFKRCLAWILMVVIVVSGIGTGEITTIQAATRKPSKIVLNQKEINTSVGCKVNLKVKSVSPKKASSDVKWTSSNKNVAVVTSKGVVTAKKKGNVTITATSKTNKKVKAKCKIKIYAATKSMKNQGNKSYDLEPGESVTLKVKVINPKKGYQPIQWSSANVKVAKVTNKGIVIAVTPGKTAIVAA